MAYPCHNMHKVNIDQNEESLLAQALGSRNALAHAFFWHHAEDFVSQAGQRAMTMELLRTIQRLRLADRFAEALVRTLSEVLGLSETWAQQKYFALLEEAQRRDRCDGAR